MGSPGAWWRARPGLTSLAHLAVAVAGVGCAAAFYGYLDASAAALGLRPRCDARAEEAQAAHAAMLATWYFLTVREGADARLWAFVACSVPAMAAAAVVAPTASPALAGLAVVSAGLFGSGLAVTARRDGGRPV